MRWPVPQVGCSTCANRRINPKGSDSERMKVQWQVNRIEVRAGAKRGETEVTLVGTLAGILALGTNKNAAPEDGGTFLLVAGVGFEPTTFRL